MDEFDGVLVDDYGWEHYTIKGKKYCKHILEIQDKKWKRKING